jgi:hypothetical protein
LTDQFTRLSAEAAIEAISKPPAAISPTALIANAFFISGSPLATAHMFLFVFNAIGCDSTSFAWQGCGKS